MLSRKVLALVGRTNVGKSTLFNALSRERRKAIVHDAPGVTRDVLEVNLDKMPGWVLRDTPGWTDRSDVFFQSIEPIYLQALQTATTVAVVLDRQYNLTLDDLEMLSWLRENNISFIVVVNKVDHDGAQVPDTIREIAEKHTTFFVSALHKKGLDALRQFLTKVKTTESMEDSADEPDSNNACHVVFAGRANVGKSTLFNACIGKEQSLVSEIPHTTRDTLWRIFEDKNGKRICFFDTAGMRKKSKISDLLEKYSVHSTEQTLKFAHVVCCVLDGQRALQRQDLRVISDACKNGRAVLLIVNKVDIVENVRALKNMVEQFFNKHFSDLHTPYMLMVSAKKRKGVKEIIPTVHKIHEEWSKRVSTGVLNQHLRDWQNLQPPPREGNTVNKILYISQINRRPPTFLLSVAKAGFPESYTRYIRGKIQETFGLEHVPVRMVVRSR